MFKKLFGGKEEKLRSLTRVAELEAGDIITLKYRNEIPEELQGKDLTVTAIGTYQYSSYTSTEFTLKTTEDKVFFLSEDDDDGEITLCFSRKSNRSEVLDLFEEEVFGLLWDEDEFPEIETREQSSLKGWTAECYRQTMKSGQGFFYNRDCRDEKLSTHESDDDGEEFQFHECEGSDDSFGLSVEIWEDGATDVYLQVYTNTDVVEQFYPHDNK